METCCPLSTLTIEGVMVAGLGKNRGMNRKAIMTAQITTTTMKTFRRMLSREGIEHPKIDLRDLKLYGRGGSRIAPGMAILVLTYTVMAQGPTKLNWHKRGSYSTSLRRDTILSRA
jgi:hypothetical protein